MEGILTEKSNRVSRLNTAGRPSQLDRSEVVDLLNMFHNSDGSVEKRLGSKLLKSNTQWGEVPVIDGGAYELNESGAEVYIILENGEIYYVPVSSLPKQPTVNFLPDLDWTQVTGSPVLNVTNNDKVFSEVVNNEIFFIDGTNQITYYGSDHVIGSVPDPIFFFISATVVDTTVAALDSVWTSGAYSYIVTAEKTSGTTELRIRQTAGVGRQTVPFTITDGVNNIEITSVEYSDNYISMTQRSGRLEVSSDAGRHFISIPNDGKDFTERQAEVLNYGKEEGLSVSDAFAAGRATILTLTNDELQKSQSASVTGTVRPDVNIIEQQNAADFFRVARESKRIAILGRSGQEVDFGFVGLSRDGYIFVSTVDSVREFGINSRIDISSPIKNVVDNVNFSSSKRVRSTIDESSQKYFCAVPMFTSTENNLVLVYDNANSIRAERNQSQIDKWSFYVYGFNGATITSLFTIFGVPHFGLSDGRVVQAEVSGHYLDIEEPYLSRIKTKDFDFGTRTHLKSLHTGKIDLFLDADQQFRVRPFVDKEVLKSDIVEETFRVDLRNVKRREVDQDDFWSEDEDDVWTESPTDLWSDGFDIEKSIDVSKSDLPNFRELSYEISDLAGTTRWGYFGFEFHAMLGEEYTDEREIMRE